MQVKVPNRLSPIVATVDNGAVSVPQALLLGQLSGHDKQVPDEVLVLRIQIVERRDGLVGHDEDVRRCFRIDVPKGDALIILVENVGVDLPVDDFLENGFLGHEADPQSMNEKRADGRTYKRPFRGPQYIGNEGRITRSSQLADHERSNVGTRSVVHF
jgi:hypothetical protein